MLLVIVWDASMKHHFHSQTRVTAADGGHHHSICSTIRPVQSFHNSDNININHIIHRQHISRIARGGNMYRVYKTTTLAVSLNRSHTIFAD